jgi:transcription antitermination factor NusG
MTLEAIAQQDSAILSEACWYAAYTRANHEKHVALELQLRAVEHFLPLYSCIRRWKDRKARLEMPLFPGYVLLRLALQHKLRVLEIPSVVRLVGFNGHPVALPENEVEALRNGLSKEGQAAPCPNLVAGRRVRITGGPFAGLEGIFKQTRNSLRVVVSLDLIQRSIAIDVNRCDVQPVR